jgi:hypothetical protein
MYSTVELQIPRKTPSLIVPDAAVVFDAQGVYVFLVENGVARQHQITEIRDLGTEMEVSEGVKAGDLAAVNPPVDLEDGKKVKLAPPTRHAERAAVAAPNPSSWRRERFALDSLLEGSGFELPVPVRQAKLTRSCR